ncbi:uncharacterized protein LOC128387427 [Panonychus citri]|uniref:uncharacterized protein LOC128387427 n=1 Tax=Panonychus citri TaxID=50023 RepID=UPI00230736D3|nr:uncharacterized protein LOC128387427 [Panonychus citri]
MYSYLSSSLDEIRLDFEAKSILLELERLKSLPENQKHRFIWELIQNAKDCARPNERVTIVINLEKDRFVFAHNGLEFRVKDLIALARRGSTKTFDENRLGTGFIKTHVLNKTVQIKGQLATARGFRDFVLTLKRSADNLNDMKILLEETYQQIDSLTRQHHNDSVDLTSTRKGSLASSPSLSTVTSHNFSSFEYHLDPDSYAMVCSALEDLRRNIIFVLVINESIDSIVVNQNGSQLKYTLKSKPIFRKIFRAKVSGLSHSMLIRPCDSFGLILGVNCSKSGSNDYYLTSISGQAKIFKEFPLIGTEDFNCAPLIQSSHWMASDLRDGLRIKKTSEAESDHIAEINRSILCAYRDYWITFISELIDLQVLNRHILAISGLPRYSNRYSDNLWFRKTIQLPLRSFIRSQDLVRNTRSTNELYYYSRIDDCLFPDCSINQTVWHSIASAIITKSKDCPHLEVSSKWIQIINQDYRDWGLPVKFSVDDAIQLIEATSIDYISKSEDRAINWLNQLIHFLSSYDCFHDLLKKRSILPSQNGILRSFQGAPNKRDQLLHHEMDNGLELIDETIKDIYSDLGDDLRDNLLHKGIDTNQLTWLPQMRVETVFINLEILLNRISGLGQRLNLDLLESAFTMSLLFHSEPDSITVTLTRVLKQLYPSIECFPICEKSYQVYPRAFFLRWTLTMLIYRIQLIVKPNEETVKVDQLTTSMPLIVNIYDWINDIIFLLEKCDLTNLLYQNQLIPLQSGHLTKITPEIYLENEPETFQSSEISFKLLVNRFVKDDQGKSIDCTNWLVDNRINCKPETIRRENVKQLTFMLDSIFKQIFDGTLNIDDDHHQQSTDWIELFHQLIVWCSDDPVNRFNLFPLMSAYKGFLMVKAHGCQSSKVALSIVHSGKEWSTIEQLINLQLDVNLLQSIDMISQTKGSRWIEKIINNAEIIDKLLVNDHNLVEVNSLLEMMNIDEVKNLIKNSTQLVNNSPSIETIDSTGENNFQQQSTTSNESIDRIRLVSSIVDMITKSFSYYPSIRIEQSVMGKDLIISNTFNGQRMSIKVCPLHQGQNFVKLTKFEALTSCAEKSDYSLCLIDCDDPLNGKFILDIGQLIEEKVKLKQLVEKNDSICITSTSTDFNVIIFKEIWIKLSIDFDSFNLHMKQYLRL